MKNWRLLLMAGVLNALLFANRTHAQQQATSKPHPAKTVKGMMQARPGGPVAEVEVEVHEAPVAGPSVAAADAKLPDNDLVLGVVVDGEAMAYPVRYIANYEVMDGRVGKTPVAPTW